MNSWQSWYLDFNYSIAPTALAAINFVHQRPRFESPIIKFGFLGNRFWGWLCRTGPLFTFPSQTGCGRWHRPYWSSTSPVPCKGHRQACTSKVAQGQITWCAGFRGSTGNATRSQHQQSWQKFTAPDWTHPLRGTFNAPVNQAGLGLHILY